MATLLIVLANAGWPPVLQSAYAHALVYPSALESAVRLAVMSTLHALALVAVLLAACSRPPLRWGMFALFAISFLASALFYRAAGHLMGYNDWVILWLARANAADAAGEYLTALPEMLRVLVPLALGFAWMPVARWRAGRWAVGASGVSVALFVAFCVVEQGNETEGLPPATSLYGMMVSTVLDRPRQDYVYATDRKPDGVRQARHIVLVMDESIRHDFFQQVVLPRFQPGIWQLYDFGIATSMANCSATSNVMLRKHVQPTHTARDILGNPLVWSLAHNAGFSTRLLDAQHSGVGHDYFDATERTLIDERPDLKIDDDAELVAWLERMPADRPSFTLVIKKGAHFSYDRRYPQDFRSRSAALNHPYVRPSPRRVQYVHAVDYQTGRFFERLSQARLPEDTVIFYTSDHGQNVGDAPGLTHCSADRPLVDEGVVPLVVLSNDDRPDLARAARLNHDRLAQSDLMETVLAMMGYGEKAPLAMGSGLMRTDDAPSPGFVYGSPFGYFGKEVGVREVDRAAYLKLERQRWGASSPVEARRH